MVHLRVAAVHRYCLHGGRVQLRDGRRCGRGVRRVARRIRAVATAPKPARQEVPPCRPASPIACVRLPRQRLISIRRRLWQQRFGLELVARREGTDPGLAQAWGLPPGDIVDQVLLRTPGMEQGGVHLVRFRLPGPAVRENAAATDLVPKSVDIAVRDIPARYDELLAAGYTFRSPIGQAGHRDHGRARSAHARPRLGELRVRRGRGAPRAGQREGLWRDAADGRDLARQQAREGVLRGRARPEGDLVQPLRAAPRSSAPSACPRARASRHPHLRRHGLRLRPARAVSCSTRARRAPTSIRARSRRRGPACCRSPTSCPTSARSSRAPTGRRAPQMRAAPVDHGVVRTIFGESRLASLTQPGSSARPSAIRRRSCATTPWSTGAARICRRPGAGGAREDRADVGHEIGDRQHAARRRLRARIEVGALRALVLHDLEPAVVVGRVAEDADVEARALAAGRWCARPRGRRSGCTRSPSGRARPRRTPSRACCRARSRPSAASRHSPCG